MAAPLVHPATQPAHLVRSTCPYCGTGCGVLIETDGVRISGVRGDPDHPANRGRLCSKGQTLHWSAAPHIGAQTRLLSPQLRAQRGAAPVALGWDAALGLAASRLAQVLRAHGPDALGFYISGQLLTEDYYVFNKLVKGLIGSNQIDSNSRLCMSSAVAGYKLTLGADAPPGCYDDIAHARTLFIAGANPAYAHPILYRRIEDARRARPTLRTIVVDPRRSETAAAADLHLALQPGTDAWLFAGMLHSQIAHGWIDRAYIDAHTQGFDALAQAVGAATPALVAQLCGIAQDDLLTAARWFAGVDEPPGPTGARTPTLSLYCQGLNQSAHGTANNVALIHLHLACGQIGRPGAAPLSLTGQPNAMGGREVGGMANLLSAHRDMANRADRAEVAALWGVDDVPAQPGRSAVEMFEAAAAGEVKALWIACTNPAHSLPDQALVRRALERAEFVVVQDAFAHIASAAYADLLLPASTWGEKEGTVTNSERCISRVRAAVPPPGLARADWRIARDLALALGPALGRGALARRLFDYPDVESVWREHQQSTRGRDLDITGLSWAELDVQPQPWPYPSGASQGRQRLYTDARFATADARARFVTQGLPSLLPGAHPTDAAPEQTLRASADTPDAQHPWALLTGRLRDQWHGMSRTGNLGQLYAHAPEPQVQLHPQALARLGVQPGDLVRLRNARGSLILPVAASDELAPQQAFVAMHWGPEVLGGQAVSGQAALGVNALLPRARCPLSKQPELKHTAVHIEPAALGWQMLAWAWWPDTAIWVLRERLRALMPNCAYAHLVPFADPAAQTQADPGPSGLLWRAANPEPPDAALLTRIEALLELDGARTLRYSDPRRGQLRSLRLGADGSLQAIVLAGDLRAQGWLGDLLRARTDVSSLGRELLRAASTAPVAVAPRSPTVCSCLGVSQAAIAQALQGPAPAQGWLAQLQATLRCGTQCGACVPQVQRIIAQAAPFEAPAANTGAGVAV